MRNVLVLAYPHGAPMDIEQQRSNAQRERTGRYNVVYTATALLAHKRKMCCDAQMISKPDPCFLDECVRLGFTHGNQRWRNLDGSRLFTWDSLHGEIEIFNARGRHLGAGDAVTGLLVKPAVKGRKIDV